MSGATDHMNARVYDPDIGRFLSPDPTIPYPNNPQSFNRYSYTQNNPLNRIDPDGFQDTSAQSPEENNSTTKSGDSVTTDNTDAKGTSQGANNPKGGKDSPTNGLKGQDIPTETIVAPAPTAPAPSKGFFGKIADKVQAFFAIDAVNKTVQGLPMVGGIRAMVGVSKTAQVAKTAATAPVAEKALQVTPEAIKAALQKSDKLTSQKAISAPVVEAYVKDIQAGRIAPAISVDGKTIVDGNHRHAAGLLTGQHPAEKAGMLSPSQASKAQPVGNLHVDLTDWGNR
jgi:RHS repeat-associated protein